VCVSYCRVWYPIDGIIVPSTVNSTNREHDAESWSGVDAPTRQRHPTRAGMRATSRCSINSPHTINTWHDMMSWWRWSSPTWWSVCVPFQHIRPCLPGSTWNWRRYIASWQFSRVLGYVAAVCVCSIYPVTFVLTPSLCNNKLTT